MADFVKMGITSTDCAYYEQARFNNSAHSLCRYGQVRLVTVHIFIMLLTLIKDVVTNLIRIMSLYHTLFA